MFNVVIHRYQFVFACSFLVNLLNLNKLLASCFLISFFHSSRLDEVEVFPHGDSLGYKH
jgi:hypothetical protein